MSDGIEHDDPRHAKYCEVIQIGIEDDTAEVTIFYTPEKGELAFIYSCFLYNGSAMKQPTNPGVSFVSLEFQVSNGYVSENKDVTTNGRKYRKLKLVTSKANVMEIRRYYDNGGTS